MISSIYLRFPSRARAGCLHYQEGGQDSATPRTRSWGGRPASSRGDFALIARRALGRCRGGVLIMLKLGFGVGGGRAGQGGEGCHHHHRDGSDVTSIMRVAIMLLSCSQRRPPHTRTTCMVITLITISPLPPSRLIMHVITLPPPLFPLPVMHINAATQTSCLFLIGWRCG